MGLSYCYVPSDKLDRLRSTITQGGFVMENRSPGVEQLENWSASKNGHYVEFRFYAPDRGEFNVPDGDYLLIGVMFAGGVKDLVFPRNFERFKEEVFAALKAGGATLLDVHDDAPPAEER